MELLLEPILAVHKAGDDEGGHIVAGGVDHGGGGVDQVGQGDGDGIGDGQLLREEHGAEDQVAGTAAAGDAGHGNGGEHGHDDGQNGLAGAEVQAEDAEQEGHLDNGAHGGTVHMHGGAQGQDDLRDILGDAGVFRGLHVGRNGGNRGAGAEGDGCRGKEMLEHNFGCSPAAAEACVNGGRDEHIDKAHHIVDNQGAAVVADQLGTVCSHQVGEEAEEADGGIVGDDLDHVHDAGGHVRQELCNQGILAAGHLNAEAEENGGNDERQDGPAAPQLDKVGLGEEVDDHVGNAQTCVHFSLGELIGAGGQGEDAHNNVHQNRGDGGGDQEGDNGGTQHFARAAHTVHIGDGGGDGTEHHRHHNAEHQVDKYGSQRLKGGSAGPDSADDAAGHDTHQHGYQEAVILEKVLLGGHGINAPYNEMLRCYYIFEILQCKLQAVLETL